MGTLLGVLLALGFVGLMVYLFSAGAASRTLNRHERDELIRLQALVDDLKETAWDHRELDSALATIMIDKIRAHERRGRELGP
jgi:hypothetical protein